jgi:hypothetical protein
MLDITEYKFFGFLAIVIFTTLIILLKMKAGIGEYNLKMFGISLILLLIVFLVIFDIDKDKLIAIVGILGTALGYLFGTKDAK